MIQAARYINVPPWELAEQPSFWMNWALACRNAEIAAEAEREKRWQKLKKKKGA